MTYDKNPLEGEILPDDISTPVDEETFKRNETFVRKNFFVTLKKALKYIPFINDLVAAYYCALDPKTPFHVRATLLAALAYFVLPFDVVPDFILGLGFTDDVTVLTATLLQLRSHLTEEHREKAQEVLKSL